LIQLLSEDEFLNKAYNIELQAVPWKLAQEKGIEVLMRRDDLIDAHLSGNKFYKLFYNLHAARDMGCNQLLTYGGAYSNHIYAVAMASKLYGFKAIGVIRGERPKVLSPTLSDAESAGMKLHFLSRLEYRNKSKSVQELSNELKRLYGDFFEIPEGGANVYGAMGTRVIGTAIRQALKTDYTSICLAAGTTNTLAGIAAGIADEVGEDLAQHTTSLDTGNVIGFSVLKGNGNLGEQVLHYQHTINKTTHNWRLINGYHCGGYAKKLPAYLQSFMREFEYNTNIRLDPVYTVKMCWGVSQMIAQNYWPRDSRLVLIHTGGLQGGRGFNL
jgi:1-aminocyclopropane-1-carboxylate deaminase